MVSAFESTFQLLHRINWALKNLWYIIMVFPNFCKRIAIDTNLPTRCEHSHLLLPVEQHAPQFTIQIYILFRFAHFLKYHTATHTFVRNTKISLAPLILHYDSFYTSCKLLGPIGHRARSQIWRRQRSPEMWTLPQWNQVWKRTYISQAIYFWQVHLFSQSNSKWELVLGYLSLSRGHVV